MNLFDCHLHSSLSFDSVEDMENYVKTAKANGDEYFITTEHMDLESNYDSRKDIVADFDLQQKIIKELSQKYDMKVLFGIEVGWRRDIHHRNLEIVEKYPFDMVILSVHEREDCDVSFAQFYEGRPVDEVYHEYLSLIYEAVQSFDNFDTFAHPDYVLRYVGHTDLEKHEEMLTKIFTVLIEKGKALEINTKIIHQPQAFERREYLVKLYASLGGRKVTIGSDGHRVSRYKNCFPQAIELLKKYSINEAVVFVNRKEHKIRL